MPLNIKKHMISQGVIILTAILILAGCNMPTQPEGADEQGMSRIGDQLAKNGDAAGAANFYQRALQRNPKDTETRKKLGDIFETHNDNPDAAALYVDGIKADPDNTEFLRAHGRVMIKLGRFADARDDYEQALRLDHGDVKALNGLGIALDFLNQHDAAQKAYREALDDEAGNLSTLNNLAHSYVLTGNYDEAIKLLEPYAQDKSATPALRQNLAEAYGLAGMEADAARMARMDLPPAQAEKNLAYYKAQRVKLALVPKFYADLGSFATEAMASAKADMVKNTFPDDMAALVMTTTPEIKAIGKTPSFVVTVTGFASMGKVHNFCEKLRSSEIGCKEMSSGS